MEKAGGREAVVFCGYGEPLMRASMVRKLAGEVKASGRKVRVNTNGLAGLYHGRPLAGEFKGLVDEMSISLGSADPGQYEELCRPETGSDAFPALMDFIGEAVAEIEKVTVTAVGYPGVDIEACRTLAESKGAEFRERKLVQ